LRLHEEGNGTSLDGEGIQAWVEWEIEAMRWRVPVEIDRSDLEALGAASEVVLQREKHRLLHEGTGGGGDLGAVARRSGATALSGSGC
jgi:hypothetical protein